MANIEVKNKKDKFGSKRLELFSIYKEMDKRSFVKATQATEKEWQDMSRDRISYMKNNLESIPYNRLLNDTVYLMITNDVKYNDIEDWYLDNANSRNNQKKQIEMLLDLKDRFSEMAQEEAYGGFMNETIYDSLSDEARLQASILDEQRDEEKEEISFDDDTALFYHYFDEGTSSIDFTEGMPDRDIVDAVVRMGFVENDFSEMLIKTELGDVLVEPQTLNPEVDMSFDTVDYYLVYKGSYNGLSSDTIDGFVNKLVSIKEDYAISESHKDYLADFHRMYLSKWTSQDLAKGNSIADYVRKNINPAFQPDGQAFTEQLDYIAEISHDAFGVTQEEFKDLYGLSHDYDYYSDFHKELYGYRPRNVFSNEYQEDVEVGIDDEFDRG